MTITPFWVSIALLLAPRALAVPTESAATSATSTTSTAAAASCTASLITTLCDYPEPGPDFAVAEYRDTCWDYCNDHPPCDFVIFAAPNPNLPDSGTCWLYPGESFDASKGEASSDCVNPYLSVYSKPVCSGGSATATADACAATASPSAIASVCGYPTPPGDCWDDCSASGSASNCLSQCAEADSCSYVVYNPHNPDNSPYADGTCWMYPNGTYDAGAATACKGDPEQYVYKNVCPKPSHSSSSSSSLSSSATGHPTGTGTGTGTATTAPGSTASTASGTTAGTASGSTALGATDSTPSGKNSAPAGLSLTYPLAIGVAILMWQALQ